MKRLFTFLKFLCLFVITAHVILVKSDLPVHIEIKDLVGKWTIEATAGTNVISNCGSSLPNNNKDNLKINDYKEYLVTHGFKLVKKFNIILSDDFITYGQIYDTSENSHRKNWKLLTVYDENKNIIGHWTTIYDEGIEIRIGNQTFTALMHYSSNGKCEVSNEDSLDSNGETECYITNPNKIRFGWFDIFVENEYPIYGCFYAEKLDKVKHVVGINAIEENEKEVLDDTTEERIEESALDDIINANSFLSIQEDDLSKFKKVEFTRKKLFSKKEDKDFNENSELHWHKLKHQGKKKEIVDKMLKKNLNQKYACPCNEQETIANRDHKEQSLNVVSHSFLQAGEKSLEEVSSSTGLVDSNILDLDTYDNEEENVNELEINQLPANFTWGDPFNNNTREYDVLNQLKCGSCYIASLMYVFKRRIEISLTKKFDTEFLKDFDDNLSIQSILSCSFYDQGCHGGYPFLVSKQAKLQGIPLEKCLPYTASDQKCPFEIKTSFSHLSPLNDQSKDHQAHKGKSFKGDGNKRKHNGSYIDITMGTTHNEACDISKRWYVKNYNYIGGCYGCNQCNGEKIMMNEMYRNGPIVASFEATQDIYNYDDGIYYEEDYKHAKRCSMRKEKLNSFNVTGWEKVNHAIVLVGWGQEEINGEIHKYWIARNSWGKGWGKEGYFKIIRGVNFNAIESQNIFVDPDFSRGAGAEILKKLSNEFNQKGN